MVKIKRLGLMMVISSPSGAGKTTLANHLLEFDPDIEMSVSVTTRLPRRGEVEGKHYFFRTEDEFMAMREAGELLEWASVFGNLYGTPRKSVEEMLAAGRDVLFDIDWQGAQQLDRNEPENLVKLFILPPSRAVLEKRLTARGQDSAVIVAKRMAAASQEISHWGEYDYIIINDDLESSFQAIRSILTAERLKRRRLAGLADFIATFS